MNRTTPLGLYCFGVSYLDTARAAKSANASIPFADPIEFLCAHGLELIFKAELARSKDMDIIRSRYGHNLLKLRAALGSDFLKKFPIDAGLENIIRYLAIGHSGPNWRNRYIETGTMRMIAPEQFLPCLDCYHTNDRRWLTDHFVKVAK